MKGPTKICHKCLYKHLAVEEDGWCYMFQEKPLDVCAQFRSKGEPASDKEALWPTNQDIDAHNLKVSTMLELVQRNQELKERVRELEDEVVQLRLLVYQPGDE